MNLAYELASPLLMQIPQNIWQELPFPEDEAPSCLPLTFPRLSKFMHELKYIFIEEELIFIQLDMHQGRPLFSLPAR